jgi:catechol 2,3-dioxygenase-like lactoylglutathione lyase family enzyme
MTEAPKWVRYHHITLNVQDVERSQQWYREVLGFTRLTGFATDSFDRVILFHPESGVTLGINRHASPEADEPFDERRAGLDHLAFDVADRDALDGWVAHFDAHNVPHSEVKRAAVPGAFLVTFRDPDNIQLEVFAPPGS